MEPHLKKSTLEIKLRELFSRKALYTIYDLRDLTGGYQVSYIYTKISDLQHPVRCGDAGRLELKRIMCRDGKKRVGRADALTNYTPER